MGHVQQLFKTALLILWVACLAAQTAVMAGLGPLFGLTRMQAVRSGLLLAAGGEFAFVALCAPTSRTCSVLVCMPWAGVCYVSLPQGCWSGR